MRAVEISTHGGPGVLTDVDRPVPVPGPGQVLIEAEAIGVNFVDTYFRTGLYPHPLPFVLGSEVCGTVAALGTGVTRLAEGDRVATLDAWFDNGGSADRAAAVLYLHPNTVRQRLRKVEQHTGRALNDPRAAAELCIALQTCRGTP